MTTPDPSELTAQYDRALRDYDALVGRGLSLDLTRGKPAPEQLDLAADLLTLPNGEYTAPDGTDCRNYGGLQGLRELREIFSGPLQVPAEQLVASDNSSLALMHDSIVHALLSPVPGAVRRWADEPRVAFLCPVPGYDRHFALCERFGIEMIPVPMTPDGPDMAVVEELVAGDAQIKGIWCVPKYSNPDGTTYSDETVRRLAGMPTAAPDFRIFWDNAYAVHDLTEDAVQIADILAACAASGNTDRALVFGSTSKVTLAGSGVAFFGSAPDNVAWYLGCTAKRTIGPDKLNHLRHLKFLRDEDGLRAHMARHRAIIRPKFDAVERILSEQLGGTGLASWSKPLGGYFVSLDVPEGCAGQVVSRAAAAGIALTPAGATHPYGDDPADRTIRVAPTYPALGDVAAAVEGLAICVRLVATEQRLKAAE
ncbi:DNA-binding transcriptional MocR family regulator [Murinocardiopsis flavida]|uniref:DNA-binding transcriptional MocR family regulator n=1 Tax=Murinocardiopsis flavida TaxID=645275 RepID=A0A2P8D4W2_9ACTN|nr:aminotransferase class I/II-fold pyridoxal phosphate-dependent enzyme [Murinocardiopsis flavida]PSK92247.1 DNA-binding transcriptional MocR family regulator [Murinocardiopsis flavida]